jgi:ectoine hydroxylase-related dioxygenase (phytanoyl-CoA dioxygenase family)
MSTLTAQQQGLLPSEKDVGFYREHGWYVSGDILNRTEIDDAKRGVDLFYSGEEDFPLPIEVRKYADGTASSSGGIRMNDFIALRKSEIRRMAFNPVIAASAARLVGTSQIRMFTSTLLVKPANHGGAKDRIGWHTDRAYWRSCTSEKMITAWVPLHDCDVTMGTLCMLDGSHRWPRTARVQEFQFERDFGSQDDELIRRMRDAGLPVHIAQLELRAGQISFHHCLTFHGSYSNLSGRDRCAISIHMQDRENRYQRVYDDRGELCHHNTDWYVRQDSDMCPDLTDPTYCPVMWETE